MTIANFVAQGKGGVSKTLTSALLAQFFNEKNLKTICLNVDPINSSFNQYKALSVKNARIIDSTGTITDEFDQTIDEIVNSGDHFVIDTGASTFSPLVTYLFENQIIEFLNNAGITVYFHVPITGGPAQADTLTGLAHLLQEFESEKVNFVVWENRFFGDIKAEGKTFKEMKVYLDNQHRIEHVITFGEQKNLFTKNFTRLNTEKLTYTEALESPDYSLMEKHRLLMIKREIFTQIEQAMKNAGIEVQ